MRGAVETRISAEGLQTLKPDAVLQSWAWMCVHSKGSPEIYLEAPNPIHQTDSFRLSTWCNLTLGPAPTFPSFSSSLSVYLCLFGSLYHMHSQWAEKTPRLGWVLNSTVSTLSASNSLYEKNKHLKDQLCPAYTVSVSNLSNLHKKLSFIIINVLLHICVETLSRK